jgi:hypothetical protein
MQIRESFGEAKSLAGTLADSEGIKHAVITGDGRRYMVVNAHSPWFKTAEAIDSECLVAVVYPGQSKEDIFRRALEQIAYPDNHPDYSGIRDANERNNLLRRWQQSIAANALTNGGK